MIKKNLYKNINVLDIETMVIDDVYVPYCICCVVNDIRIYEYLEMDNKKDIIITFFEKVIKNFSGDRKISFYAHNLNFDGTFVLKSLSENQIKFDCHLKEKNIYYISFIYLENEITIKCSYKLFPISLKNYSIFSNNKKKTTFPYLFSSMNNLSYKGPVPNHKYFKDVDERDEYIKYNGDIFDFREKCIDYCFNDVFLTKDLIISILDCMDDDYIKIFIKSFSAPSFSYKIFFKYFNKHNIPNKLKLEDYTYIKNSFFGGRCEVFGNKNYGEFIHSFDFSGMYGTCMLQDFPIGDGVYYTNPKKDYYTVIGFHTVEYISDMTIPVLPYKNNKLFFSNGTMIGTYWYEEIVLFVKNGGVIKRVINSYIYEKSEYVFADFINHFNKYRDKGGFYKTFGKLIINSLYGGFALREDDYFTHFTFSELEAESIRFNFNVVSQDYIGCIYISKIIKDSKSNSIFNKKEMKWSNKFSIRNITYSSIISSKARIKLYNSFKKVEMDGGRILYCDTDSIFASYKINKKDMSIGEVTWKEVYVDGFFISPKFYGYINENNEKIVKIKGVTIKDSLSYDQIKTKFYEGCDEITFSDQFVMKFKNLEVYQGFINKNIKLNSYDKRLFDSNRIMTQAIRYECQ